MARRDYPAALADHARAVREAPDRPSRIHALREQAGTLIAIGDLAGAARALEAVVRLAPAARDLNDLGIVRARLGQPAAAEAALRRARDLAPRDPRPRRGLAALLVNQRRFDEALAEYRALKPLVPRALADKVAIAIELVEAEAARGRARAR
jgi:Flp pilus assembly protein TadD